MKLFEKPVVEVVNFAEEDILTVSPVDPGEEEEGPAIGGKIGTNCG